MHLEELHVGRTGDADLLADRSDLLLGEGLELLLGLPDIGDPDAAGVAVTQWTMPPGAPAPPGVKPIFLTISSYCASVPPLKSCCTPTAITTSSEVCPRGVLVPQSSHRSTHSLVMQAVSADHCVRCRFDADHCVRSRQTQ